MDKEGQQQQQIYPISPNQRKRSIFDPSRLVDKALILHELREKLDEAKNLKNLALTKRQPIKQREILEAVDEGSDALLTPKTTKSISYPHEKSIQRKSQILVLKTQDSQFVKDLLKNKQFYNQKLEVTNVDLTNDEDSEIVIHILKKEFKNKKETNFLKMAISGLNLFKQNSDILFKGNMSHSLFRELKYEFFLKNEEIFSFGDFGFKYYIVLKGGVQLLIPKPEIAKEMEKKREEKQVNKNQAFLKRMAHQSSTPQAPSKRKSSIKSESFTQFLMTNINGKRNSIRHAQNSAQDLDEEEKQHIDTNLPFEQVMDNYYKGWNQIKLFKNGEAFGEIALLTKQRRTGTMICKEDTHIMSLTKDAFDKILGKYHERVKQEKIGFLRQFQVFDGVPVSKLMSLILDMKTSVYQINNVLYEEGDKVDNIFFIKNGEVELSKLTNVQIQKDGILNPNSKHDEKFIMYNLKHSRQVQKEQKKRMRISLLTNGQCFGDYEIKQEEPFRSQKAVVSQENTEIYSLHKTLLLDMLKTHKITDNIVKQNVTNIKFHEEREKDIIEQQQKNHEETEKLMKKHIQKKLKHAMKLPDLSLLTEEEQKILYEQFPYLKTQQQKNQQLLQNSIERISGSSQQNIQTSMNKNNENSKNNEEDNSELNSSKNNNLLINGPLDIERYQEFTSKFLKKPIFMKLSQDTKNKKMMLQYLKKNKKLGKYSTDNPLQHISSNSDSLSFNLKSGSEDSESNDEQDEIIQSSSKDWYSQRDDINENSFYNQLYSSSARNSFYNPSKLSTQNSSKTIGSQNKRNSVSMHNDRPRQHLKMIKCATFKVGDIEKQQGNTSLNISYNQTVSSEQSPKNNNTSLHKDQIGQKQPLVFNRSGQSSNRNSSSKSHDSQKRLNQILDVDGQSQKIYKLWQNNKNGQEELNNKYNKQQDRFEDHVDNIVSNNNNTKNGNDYDSATISNNNNNTLQPKSNNLDENTKQQLHSPKSNKKSGRCDTPDKQIEYKPQFWIEDNNLLSKEQMRRKISYAIYQSKQFINVNKLNVNQYSVYVGNELIKVSTHSLPSSATSSKQESMNKDKNDKLFFESQNNSNQKNNNSNNTQVKTSQLGIRQSQKQELNTSKEVNSPQINQYNEKYSNSSTPLQVIVSESQLPQCRNSISGEIIESQTQFFQNTLSQRGNEEFNDQQPSLNEKSKNNSSIINKNKIIQIDELSKNSGEQYFENTNQSHSQSQNQEYSNILQQNTLNSQQNDSILDISHLQKLEQKNPDSMLKQFTACGQNLIFSCDVSQDVRLIKDVNASPETENKVDRILSSYFNYKKKRNSINESNSSGNILTSKQKRDIILFNNYHLLQGVKNLNNSSVTTSLQNKKQNLNSQTFNQAAENILSKPNQIQNQNIFFKPNPIQHKHRQTKSLQNNNSVFNLVMPSNKDSFSIAEQQSLTPSSRFNQVGSNQYESQQNYLLPNEYPKTKSKRNSIKVFSTIDSLQFKSAEFSLKSQHNMHNMKLKQTDDIIQQQINEAEINQQVRKSSQTFSHQYQYNNLKQNNNSYYLSSQSTNRDNLQYSTNLQSSNLQSQNTTFKSGNRSGQILKNFLSNNQGTQVDQNTQLTRKQSLSQIIHSNFDQMKNIPDQNRVGGLKPNASNLGMRSQWNSNIRIQIGNIQTVQSEVVSPTRDDHLYNIFKSNQAVLPTFPKMVPSPIQNVFGRENSRDLKAQQLLLKRNLV